MKTRQTSLIRHQLTIDGFPMRVYDLIRKLQDLARDAQQHTTSDQLMIGFQAYDPMITEESALVIQWDQQVDTATVGDVQKKEGENDDGGS